MISAIRPAVRSSVRVAPMANTAFRAYSTQDVSILLESSIDCLSLS